MAVNIIPVSEMARQLKRVLDALEAGGEPYLITQNSRPKAVLVRYEDYNDLVDQATRAQSPIVRRPGISGGEPIIRGTRISVRHIVERVQAGQSVNEILAALPHLTAAQVYDALSYYHSHQSEIDQLIEESKPERVLSQHGLRAKKIADGVAIIVDDTES